MIIEQLFYNNHRFNKAPMLSHADLVIIFGCRKLIEDNTIFDQIRKMYPTAYLMGCSTAGEIQEDFITEDLLNLTAVWFEKAYVKCGSIDISNDNSYFDVGKTLASSIEQNELKHIFILTDGVNMNGSKLLEGMKSVIGTEIPITGGLSGDGNDFFKTAVIANHYAKDRLIVYAAFYGDIKTGCSAYGGWDTFGIERIVTKSQDNILYELDSKPALDIYKKYLGDKASELPASGLRFPMSFRYKDSKESIVRSMLDIDEETNSMIFRADIPQGSLCKLMKSNTYNLIDAAKIAVERSQKMLASQNAELAIIISCVGRKVVLKQRTEEEIESIRDLLGKKSIITGYYSYGEIGPAKEKSECEMHNQTMTVTLFSEYD